jgi:hypothetical protein
MPPHLAGKILQLSAQLTMYGRRGQQRSDHTETKMSPLLLFSEYLVVFLWL